MAEDRVNYRFINGFVDVGDAPCRVALLEELKTRQVSLDRDWEADSINLPGLNRRLEFSAFWHRPTRLSRWCKAIFRPEVEGNHPFTLATCGSVHIWVDGKLAARFEPFSHNLEQRMTISLPLKQEGSEVVMLLEELAERDTNWYVELTLGGNSPIETLIESKADPDVVEQVMALARDIRPVSEFVTGSPLVLCVDAPTDTDVKISATISQDVHLRNNPPLLATQGTMKAGTRTVSFDGIDTLPDGYHALHLSLDVGETRIARQIAFAKLEATKPSRLATTIADRKREALLHAAGHGEKRIGRALAILATGNGCTPLCAELIENALTSIDDRLDCADFILVPLLWLYHDYQDDLPQTLAARIRTSIQNFRYWVDEPGNDVMWFWSENHALCFHTAHYLAARLFPDAMFPASGRRGHQQAVLAEERLGHWFASVEAHGFAEWNSAAYYPIDFIGLFSLFQFGDGAIKRRAKRLLDRLFRMIALHTLAGVPAGSMGRAYDKELRAGPNTELAPIAAIVFGSGWLNDAVAALPMLCLSDYEPPDALSQLVAPPQGQALEAHYVQGYGHAGRLALYKTASVQLSASIDGAAGAIGHQQHMIDIRFAAHPFARAWINHPGEDDPWGHQRPSYWAGNGSMPRVGQYGNAALMLYDIPPEHRIDFTHVFAPTDAFDHREIHGDWLVLKSGSAFAALRACAPLEKVMAGPGENREIRSCTRKAGWIVIVGDLARELSEQAALANVLDLLEKTVVQFDASTMTLSLQQPQAPLLTLSYEHGLSVNHQHRPFPNDTLELKIQTLPAICLGRA